MPPNKLSAPAQAALVLLLDFEDGVGKESLRTNVDVAGDYVSKQAEALWGGEGVRIKTAIVTIRDLSVQLDLACR